ncbi:MAG: 6-bladed beta-propeller, partial [Bacteroidales bacterium]|nr:6-bladed beta-propeller [Bacteroidales bacterium]
LTSISNSLDITGKRSGFARFILGEFEELAIAKPYGMAIHDGKIYICDTGLDVLEIIDLQQHSFEYFMPTGLGQLKKPVNCNIDENGYLYVADGERRQVVIFDPSGKYVNSIGETENFKPTDVFVKGDKIWITNFVNNEVLVYNKESFELLYTLPESESGNEDYLYSPSNIYVTDDMVYVSDFGDFKVKIYTHQGDFIMSVGSYGNKIGQFVRPKGIAVDSESNLYVVDAGFENTQIFDKEGNLLMFFGGPYQKPGDLWLPAKVIIDYDNLTYFEDYVYESFNLKYLIFVTSQYGPDKINVYGYVEPK